MLFRVLRTSLVILVILVITLALYINRWGLPTPLERKLIAELRSRGVELTFSRIRLRWTRGIVAENVSFGRADEPLIPRFYATQAQLRLNHAELRHLRIALDGIVLREGRLNLPVTSANQRPRKFAVQNVHGELWFQPNDRWELRNLEGRALGVMIKLSGSLTNASELRAWRFPERPKERERATNFWYQLVSDLEKVQVASPAELTSIIGGDARDLKSFNFKLIFSAPSLGSPWGSGKDVLLSASLGPSAMSRELPRVEVKVHLDQPNTRWGHAETFRLNADFVPLLVQQWLTNTGTGDSVKIAVVPSVPQPWLTNGSVRVHLRKGQTRWGRAENLRLDAQINPDHSDTNLVRTELKLLADQVHADWRSGTNWINAGKGQLTVRLMHVLTNLIPLGATGQVEVADARTTWGDSQRVWFRFGSERVGTNLVFRARSLNEWIKLAEAFTLDWETELTGVQSPKLQLDKFFAIGQWRPPELRADRLRADLYGGHADATALLNTATRVLSLSGNSDFDAQKISPLLNTNGQRWLAQHSWEKPPLLEGRVSLTLPAWTNEHISWTNDIRPTVQMRGSFQAGPCAYREVPFDSARSTFSFSNLIWRLPDLLVTRPEGIAELNYTANTQTRDFHWVVRSGIDPHALRPWLKKEAQHKLLDDFQFTGAPFVEADIWGRWRAVERLGVIAKVAATNFTFREQSVQDCVTRIQFTNNFLTFADIDLHRSEGRASAPQVGYDFSEKKLYLTNVVGALDQEAVMKALGPKVAKTLEPYRFSSPPTVRINGVLDLKKGSSTDDAHFDIDGGPFQWKRYRLTRVAGRIDWVNDTLVLTNVLGVFHNGQILGNAFFDFTPTNGNDFSFHLALSEADLQSLMADLTTKTNKLEGKVDGDLTVTSANTADLKSWQGYGGVSLRDGLIWEIPVFGIFSSALNLISPGLGNGRARQGAATFTITNSVIHSRNLEVHMMGARLRYEGTVDFQGNVEGRMEAGLFRDVPILGPIIKTVLWPVSKAFEYKIMGTLSKPKKDLIYLPNFLLHPFKALKDLLPGEQKPPEENKPEKPPPP